MKGKILSVRKNSLAEELELRAGDSILEVNGRKIRDIIELSFELAYEEIEMLIEHSNGERELIEFEKDIDEELGVEFESAVFDGIRRCSNNCYFCFVNMIDPRMRKSLAIKDDDYRLSFLYGNFITLSNLTEKDFNRIERLHLSPLFVSIHTMDSKLRSEMLRCNRAGKIREQLDRLEKSGVEYHTQIVLCRNLNDGKFLEETLDELVARKNHVLSIAIVPVGITKFRNDPFSLEQFDRDSAIEIIEQVERWQLKMRRDFGETFIYLGDEFYLLANRDFPPEEFYDGFPQLDNGIGLARSFIEDFRSEEISANYDREIEIAIISGTSIAPTLKNLAVGIPNVKIKSLPINNVAFGSTVNVSGLLTGRDILNGLQNLESNPDGILIPASALRAGENVFLDDFSLEDLQREIPSKIIPIQNGNEFREALCHFFEFQTNRFNRANYMWQSNAAYTK